MSYATLLRHVEDHTRLTPARAESVVASTLSILLRTLEPDARLRILENMRGQMPDVMDEGPTEFVTDALGSLAEELDMSLARAREHLQVVGAGVALSFDGPLVELFRSSLRESLVPFLRAERPPASVF